MTNSLHNILKERIESEGAISVAEYMALCLGHPEYGYYMRGDPFGREGDFTTAPEVSQMFGEILGAYFVHQWMQRGQPERFTFLECGPGRGTLMADMMRAGSAFPGFCEAAGVHLLETSPSLKEKQGEVLEAYSPVWHEDLSSVPDDVPVFAVGNEFLDALPVRQFVRDVEGWRERFVDYDQDEGFHFVTLESDESPADEMRFKAGLGQVVEDSPVRVSFVKELCALLRKTGGAGLFIDYGHVKSAPGDTFQAIKSHEYCGVFEHIGQADLTAHVDFEVISNVAELEGAQVSGPVEQGEFLNVMGLSQRAAALADVASPAQAEDIKKALHRLTHADEMGGLFKVIGFGYGTT